MLGGKYTKLKNSVDIYRGERRTLYFMNHSCLMDPIQTFVVTEHLASILAKNKVKFLIPMTYITQSINSVCWAFTPVRNAKGMKK